MLANWRDQILVLAAVRHGLSTHHARAAHLLPDLLQRELMRARPTGLGREELLAALTRTAQLYLAELARHDEEYATRIAPTIERLCQGGEPPVTG